MRHALFFLCTLLCISRAVGAVDPYRIEVVEKGSGWPVPLVELRTVSEVRFVSDNAGLVAFDLPECMGRETWLSVQSPSYEVPADGFGSRGFRCTPVPGGRRVVEVTRRSVAKRLGRLTGSGLFGESQKLGERRDWRESGVTGSDTAQVTEYQGKLFWAWGDTNLFGYPLGIYRTSAATTPLRPLTSLQPPVALPYEYFRNDKGQPRPVIDVPENGPIWVAGCVTLPDQAGRPHLVCEYQKIQNHLETVERGLAEWDDASAGFRLTTALWKKGEAKPASPRPAGHAAFWQDAGGKRWVYFGEGLLKMRCPATYEDWKNPGTWERVDAPEVLTAADGEKVTVASGAVAWNAWRKRWVAVVQQKFGKTSPFGEIWYAEARTPGGPWGTAVRVLSHHDYTFYNPLIHAELTPPDSPVLLFEGTYTDEFSGHPVRTARYNYNQVLYRLDLNDPALAPAQENGAETSAAR